ncbi:hypothetical protein [Desnuesiella massiliensis]|uniref:hypothetical protein n=1 Tax=Desnuesiella massiliensis TaxID=1650662 RepID=UPI0006E3E2E3|nr:hypothetical protein [Desnuesiella massiliensis]
MKNDFERVLLENCLGVEDLDINLNKLNFEFLSKPLLIGGKAMEYYQIRESGQDIDFVIAEEDYEQLSYKYPNHVKEIYDDFGVCKYEFEMWKSICLLDYKFLSEEAVEEDNFLIISFEKLMFLKVLAMRQPKYLRDLELMRDRMAEINTILHDFY